MSAEALGWVIRHSPYTAGHTFLVHCMVADVVNDQNGNEFYMAQKTLASKCRISARTAWEALGMLEHDGFLTLLENNSRAGKPNRYRFEFPQAAVVFESRVRKTCEPGSQVSPKGSQVSPKGFANPAYITQRELKELRASCRKCEDGWIVDPVTREPIERCDCDQRGAA